MRFITLLSLLCLLSACAVPSPPAGRQAETGELSQLQARQDELTRQVSTLQQSVQQLEEKLQAQQALLARFPQPAAEPQIVTPGSQTTTGAPAAAPTSPEEGGQPSGPSATAVYLKAFSDYASGRFNEAEKGFRAFLEHFSDNDFAGNAQFWLGECYYSQRLLTRAAHEFELVVDNYPDTAKAPDALLRMGEIYRELNRNELADQTDQRLLDNYPQSQAARKLRAKP